MPDKPPLPREEVERVLSLLEPLAEEKRIILIGGQAVAFWASFLQTPDTTDDSALYTSKDIDFEGAARSARLAGDLLGGKVRIPTLDEHTPHTGLVLFEDSDGVQREVDFLKAPGGLSDKDVRATAVRVALATATGQEVPLWVMHPERCMESRVHNVMELGQSGSIAMDQLRRSIACAKAWSARILEDESIGPVKRVRAILDINERVFRKCTRNRNFRNLVLEHEVEPFDAVLSDDERLPKNFREIRYPQMVEQLEARRSADHEHRRRYSHPPRKRSTPG